MSESMEELMARDLVRQIDEITRLQVTVVRLERELAIVKRQRDDEVRMREALSSELWDREQERDQLRADLTQAKLLKPRTATDVLFPGAA
jgi:hypothetical protein